MLTPQTNAFRAVTDLSGLWDFQVDPQSEGEAAGWVQGLPSALPMAVPGSWNELRSEYRDYLDDAWYARTFQVPSTWHSQRIVLRFESVNYAATVWLNGVVLGSHEGGHLPFEFDITDKVRSDSNRLTVKVNNTLRPDRVPTGGDADSAFGGFMRSHPKANFDFFPYAGIQRAVKICAIPRACIQGVRIQTGFESRSTDGRVAGWLQVAAMTAGSKGNRLVCTVRENGQEVARQEFSVEQAMAEGRIEVPNARLWNTSSPFLYQCMFSLLDAAGEEIDQYALHTGIRTVQVEGSQILLNGEPVFLKGFGKHEDFPVLGRSFSLPLIVKDGALLEWIGANSYRTSHYPYAEEAMDYADRAGLLIVDEIPAVGLMFDDNAELRETQLQICKQQLSELIARDGNHPSVIMWSVANEPMPADFMQRFQGKEANPEADAPGTRFFAELIDHGRQLDDSRPFTLAGVMGGPVPWLALCDAVMVNRYWGWYVLGGQRGLARRALEQELEALHTQLQKPIIIAEFGADAIAGHHSQPSEMFSEEYQAEILEDYLETAAKLPYVAGLHVWNFADFKTGQGVMRPTAMNHKGVFTRDRRPKMAAHYLRSQWHEAPEDR